MLTSGGYQRSNAQVSSREISNMRIVKHEFWRSERDTLLRLPDHSVQQISNKRVTKRKLHLWRKYEFLNLVVKGGRYRSNAHVSRERESVCYPIKSYTGELMWLDYQACYGYGNNTKRVEKRQLSERKKESNSKFFLQQVRFGYHGELKRSDCGLWAVSRCLWANHNIRLGSVHWCYDKLWYQLILFTLIQQITGDRGEHPQSAHARSHPAESRAASVAPPPPSLSACPTARPNTSAQAIGCTVALCVNPAWARRLR